jgi:hypothetical protein
MSHAGGSRGTPAAPVAAYKTGKYVSPWGGLGTRSHDITRSGIFKSQSLVGEFDWDSLANVQRHLKDIGTIRTLSQKKAEYWGKEYKADAPYGDPKYRRKADVKTDDFTPSYYTNPFYSQGLGPKNFIGVYHSDVEKTHARFWEATEAKFQRRAVELQGIADSPGDTFASRSESYAEQQAAKKLLGKPFPEAAAAAEQLRLERGGGSARRGGGVATSGRQGRQARAAEQARLGRSQTSAGSSPRRRLRASNLLGQPLGGGGSQTSARQLLG